MTLYVLIALALGAVTSVADAAVPAPAVANIFRASAVGVEERVARVLRRPMRRTQGSIRRRMSVAPLFVAADAPLTGAASPRAPGRR